MERLLISMLRGVLCALVMVAAASSSGWAAGIDGYGPDGLRPDAESIALVAKAVEEVSGRLLDVKEQLVVRAVEGRDTRQVAQEIAALEEVLLKHTQEFTEMIRIVSDAKDGELPVWLKGTMAVVLDQQGQISDPRFSVKKRRRNLHADLASEIEKSEVGSWLTLDRGSSELVVHLELPVIFSAGGSRVSSEYRETLRRVAAVLKAYRPRVVVTGYTDAKTKTRYSLSTERAANVAREFLNAGIDSDALSIQTRQEVDGMDRVEVSFQISTSSPMDDTIAG